MVMGYRTPVRADGLGPDRQQIVAWIEKYWHSKDDAQCLSGLDRIERKIFHECGRAAQREAFEILDDKRHEWTRAASMTMHPELYQAFIPLVQELGWVPVWSEYPSFDYFRFPRTITNLRGIGLKHLRPATTRVGVCRQVA